MDARIITIVEKNADRDPTLIPFEFRRRNRYRFITHTITRGNSSPTRLPESPPSRADFPRAAVYYIPYLNFTRPHVARNDTLFDTRANRRADHHISIVLDDFTLARVGHAGTGDDILTYTAIATAICIRYPKNGFPRERRSLYCTCTYTLHR